MKKIFIIIIAFVALYFNCLAQNVNLNWAIGWGGLPNGDMVWDIAIDDDGNTYAAGRFSGTVDFDPGPGSHIITSTDPDFGDGFVAKYDGAGNLVWVKSFGDGGQNTNASAIALKGNTLYVWIRFVNRAIFGRDTLLGLGVNNLAVLKLDTSGTFQWIKRFEGYDVVSSITGSTTGGSIDIDSNYNVYISGRFANWVDLNPNDNVSDTFYLRSSGMFDGFIVKLDSAGSFVWGKQIAGPKKQEIGGITIDKAGNIYATGVFMDTTYFDPASSKYLYGTPTSESMFILKLDNSGNYIWAKEVLGAPGTYGHSIATDEYGNVYTTGTYYFTVDFDPSSGSTYNLTATGFLGSTFVLKLDSLGNFVWAGNTGGESASDIKMDNGNNVYTTGYFRGTQDFDPGITAKDTFLFTSKGSIDIFVSKLDQDGKFIWAKQFGGKSFDNGRAIAIDHSGNIYVGGGFQDTCNFNLGNLNEYNLISQGRYDCFLFKLTCNDTSNSFQTVSVCNAFEINNTVFTKTGIYEVRMPNAAGCDSIITIDLTILSLEPVVRVDSFTLSTAEEYATYQWYKDGVLIQGAVNREYTVAENGKYKVDVSDIDGCTGTSEEYLVNNVSIEDVNNIGKIISVFPNPANDILHISSPVAVDADLYSIEGKKMVSYQDVKFISTERVANGIYLLNVKDKNGNLLKVTKIVKQ